MEARLIGQVRQKLRESFSPRVGHVLPGNVLFLIRREAVVLVARMPVDQLVVQQHDGRVDGHHATVDPVVQARLIHG